MFSADMNDTLFPASFAWKNQPLSYAVDPAGQISITAGAETDWFIDPAGDLVKMNAPVALFAPPDDAFCLQAKVAVEFAATYDAGVLFVYDHDHAWAKLCFEYSPQRQPTIVSVVTREASDDANCVAITEPATYLRLYRRHDAFAFHYSQDGRYWHLVRYFTLGRLEHLQVGFSAQSPTGQACRATFSEIRYTPGRLANLRSGD